MVRKFIKVKEEYGELNVYNHKGEYLGWIEFQDEWKAHKQYIFYPAENTFFTAGCIAEIKEHLEKLNTKRKV